MKRILFESVKAFPYTPDQAVDRLDALSAVLGIGVSAADPDAEARITVSHADTAGGAYEPVLDARIFMGNTRVERDGAGEVSHVFTAVPVETGDLVNTDIDLVGCKRFVKIGVAYTANGSPATVTAACVLTLGDFGTNPPA